jgi:hypothetical protein
MVLACAVARYIGTGIGTGIDSGNGAQGHGHDEGPGRSRGLFALVELD